MDDRLRALERAARADPSDAAAGWAFVRALDQAGDALGAWRERCRLARAGDDEAWAELHPRAAPRPPAQRRLRGRLRRASASPAVVAVALEDRLLGLEPETLDTRWTLEPVDRVVAHGPYVVLARNDTSTHVVRDARDARLVAETYHGEFVRIEELEAWGDRAIARCLQFAADRTDFDTPVTLTLDLAERPGAILATLPGERNAADLLREHEPPPPAPFVVEQADRDEVRVARLAP